jgi:hypothetical protein
LYGQMEEGRWPKRIYNWILPGNRRIGWPRKLWKEGILQAMTRSVYKSSRHDIWG